MEIINSNFLSSLEKDLKNKISNAENILDKKELDVINKIYTKMELLKISLRI